MKKYIWPVLIFVCFVTVLSFPLLRARSETSPVVMYLKEKPLSPWSIMALAAAGENPSLESLKQVPSEKAIELEAPILALTAAGKDPRSFGSDNLVEKLKLFYDGTKFGEAGILNDDIFGLLALVSAGEPISGSLVSGLVGILTENQNSDGGFSFAVGGSSDTNTTAAAIMALRAAGTPAEHQSISKALAYLKSAQNDDGGFPYDPKSSWGTASDASSDAWVIAAFRSAGLDPVSVSKDGAHAVSHLESLQQEGGFFLYQAGGQEDSFTPVTTSYALVALSGKFLPVRIVTPEAPQKVAFSFRIEGREATLCKGEGEGVVALEAVALATRECGITSHEAAASFGTYIDEIGGEKASGMTGWMYFVNAEMPSVGAGAYQLKVGDEVLWYFGDFGWKPTRIELDSQNVLGGETFSGRVAQFEREWTPLAGAVIEGGGARATTDASGRFTLSPREGRQVLIAEKEGFVRSSIEVTAGSPHRTEVPLEVTLSGPQGEAGGGNSGGGETGSSITLIIDGENGGSMSFGTLAPGDVGQKSVSLRNEGDGAVALSTEVAGDGIFRRYVRVNERGWRQFQAPLEKGAATSTKISLSIPLGYSQTGTKTGTLIFWATPLAQ